MLVYKNNERIGPALSNQFTFIASKYFLSFFKSAYIKYQRLILNRVGSSMAHRVISKEGAFYIVHTS